LNNNIYKYIHTKRKQYYGSWDIHLSIDGLRKLILVWFIYCSSGYNR
jgi:hypothetical protein